MVALVGGTLNFLVAEAHPRTRGAYLGVGQHRAVALPRAALLLLQMQILKHISISLAALVLTAAARLGGAGRLVENLADVSERVERAPAIEVERIVFGREFCSREKQMATESEKPSGARRYRIPV